MGKYIRWAVTALIIVMFIGGIAFFIANLLSSKDNVTENKPTPEQQAILDKDFAAQETISDNEFKEPSQVYDMLHEMANTKIIAEDGQIWGLKAVTKQRVERVQKAVKDLGIKDAKINEMLDRWSKKDFSQAVEEHNYIWEHYLEGTIGKAIKLR